MSQSTMQNFQDQILSIEAYIKAYHYSNFDEVYAEFDRDNNYLLDPIFIVKEEDYDIENQNSKAYSSGNGFDPSSDPNYESKYYLRNFGISKLNKLFKKLRMPFETDEKRNIIDFNWHVDKILKGS